MPYKDPAKKLANGRDLYLRASHHRNRPEGRARQLADAARSRSRRAGRPYTLTHEWILSRLLNGHCEVTGFPFIYANGKRDNPYSPSIDGVVGSQGYTPENCRVVITAFNLGRNRWDDETLYGWAKAFCLKHESAH